MALLIVHMYFGIHMFSVHPLHVCVHVCMRVCVDEEARGEGFDRSTHGCA